MDLEFLKLLSEIRNPILTYINTAFTTLGGGTIFLIIFCLIFWCFNKKFAYKIGFVYVLSGIAVHTLKIVCQVKRPWVRDPSLKVSDFAKSTAGDYSFPSGHSQNATAIMSTVAFKVSSKILKVLCYVVIFLIMFSRMYFGVHTPQDVGVAFLITIIISSIINYYMENYSIDEQTRNYFNIALIVLSIAMAFVIAIIFFTDSSVPIGKLIGSTKYAGGSLGFSIGYLIERKKINFNPIATSTPKQILKFAIGIALTVGIHLGMKTIIALFFSNILPMYFVEYFITFMFVLCIYPYFIKKYFTSEFYL